MIWLFLAKALRLIGAQGAFTAGAALPAMFFAPMLLLRPRMRKTLTPTETYMLTMFSVLVGLTVLAPLFASIGLTQSGIENVAAYVPPARVCVGRNQFTPR
jgi:hypothetical protein